MARGATASDMTQARQPHASNKIGAGGEGDTAEEDMALPAPNASTDSSVGTIPKSPAAAPVFPETSFERWLESASIQEKLEMHLSTWRTQIDGMEARTGADRNPVKRRFEARGNKVLLDQAPAISEPETMDHILRKINTSCLETAKHIQQKDQLGKFLFEERRAAPAEALKKVPKGQDAEQVDEAAWENVVDGIRDDKESLAEAVKDYSSLVGLFDGANDARDVGSYPRGPASGHAKRSNSASIRPFGYDGTGDEPDSESDTYDVEYRELSDGEEGEGDNDNDADPDYSTFSVSEESMDSDTEASDDSDIDNARDGDSIHNESDDAEDSLPKRDKKGGMDSKKTAPVTGKQRMAKFGLTEKDMQRLRSTAEVNKNFKNSLSGLAKNKEHKDSIVPYYSFIATIDANKQFTIEDLQDDKSMLFEWGMHLMHQQRCRQTEASLRITAYIRYDRMDPKERAAMEKKIRATKVKQGVALDDAGKGEPDIAKSQHRPTRTHTQHDTTKPKKGQWPAELVKDSDNEDDEQAAGPPRRSNGRLGAVVTDLASVDWLGPEFANAATEWGTHGEIHARMLRDFPGLDPLDPLEWR